MSLSSTPAGLPRPFGALSFGRRLRGRGLGQAPNQIQTLKQVPKMTKTELVAKIAAGAGLTKVQAEQALTALLETLTDTLKGSGGVTLNGLGSFSVVRREARQGHNPQTKAPLVIPASNSVKFKVAKALKDALN